MKKIVKSLKKSSGLITSLVVVAAVLPIVLVATLSEDLRLRSFASNQPELRIWTEPKSVVAKPDSSFQLKVYAEGRNVDQLIPEVKFKFMYPDGIEMEPTEIEYNNPFSGKAVVGVVNVTANKDGVMELGIPEASVFSRLPNLNITTQGSVITVRK